MANGLPQHSQPLEPERPANRLASTRPAAGIRDTLVYASSFDGSEGAEVTPTKKHWAAFQQTQCFIEGAGGSRTRA